MPIDLPPHQPKPLEGNEPFHKDSRPLPFSVSDFWRWSASDLLNNTQRGILAEFLVAKALDNVPPIRTEWAAYDLETASGTSIEVKSAAYLQSWHQDRPSKISFNIRPTRGWDPETNTTDPHARRQADIYVFCLLHHQDEKSVDPLDLSQWRFYAVPTEYLDRELPTQKSITLGRLEQLGIQAVEFDVLRSAIEELETSGIHRTDR